MKKTKHLELSDWILWGLSKFSRIRHEYRIFLSLVLFFVKNWQWLTLCSSQSKRLIIARCKIKWQCSDIILCSWSIRENLYVWKKNRVSPSIWEKKSNTLNYPWKKPNTYLDRLYVAILNKWSSTSIIASFLRNGTAVFLNNSNFSLIFLNFHEILFRQNVTSVSVWRANKTSSSIDLRRDQSFWEF